MINQYSIDYFNGLSDGELRDLFDNAYDDTNMNKVDNIRDKNTCLNCKKSGFMTEDTTSGFIVCTNCAHVADKIVDDKPEWHTNDDGVSNARCSGVVNQLLPQSSIGTVMSGKFSNRLKKIQSWKSMPYRERTLNMIFKMIHEKCIEGKIIKCVEDDAKIYYKNVTENVTIRKNGKKKFIIIRGKNRKIIIAACVYLACRKNKHTRTLKEIAKLFVITSKELSRGCKTFMTLINSSTSMISTNHPEHFITRLCNDLKLNKFHTNQAIDISRNATKLNIASSHTPFSIALSSILIMANENKIESITKTNIAIKFNISETTLTKTIATLEKYKKALFDSKLAEQVVLNLEKERTEEVPLFIRQRLAQFTTQEDKEDKDIIKETTEEENYEEYMQEIYDIDNNNGQDYSLLEIDEDTYEMYDEDEYRDSIKNINIDTDFAELIVKLSLQLEITEKKYYDVINQ